MDNNEIKDLTRSSAPVAEQKALAMKLLAAKIRAAKRSALSFSQERIWSITQLNPDNTAFNISNSMYIFGELDEAVLEKSLSEMIRRQEILRSIFIVEDGQPIQITLPIFSFKLKIIDLSTSAGRAGARVDETFLEQTISNERKHAFDLSKDLPFRATLLQLAKDKYILILVLHQIVIDAESWPIVIQELGSIYPAFKQGIKPVLPILAMQYADYAVWQRERLQGDSYTLLKEYWRDKYQEAIAPLQLPADRFITNQPAQAAAKAYAYPFSIGAETLTKLKQFSGQEKVSTFVTLLTTFNCLLYMYTQQEQMVIFTSVSAKNRPELKPLVGLFSNLVPIQVKIRPHQNLKQLQESIYKEVNDVVAHQDLPLDQITEFIKLKIPEQSMDDGARPRAHATSLFQAMFTFRYMDEFDYHLGDIRLEPIEMDLEKEFNFQIRLGMKEIAGRLDCTLTYNATVFEETTIGQIVEHYLTLLESYVNTADQPIAEQPVFQLIERHRERLAQNRANFAQDQAGTQKVTEYVAPRNETETKLAALWQEILGVQKVGIYDNFFELGGHSLNATILMGRIQQTFQVEIPLGQIFQTPTIARIAEYLGKGAESVYYSIPAAAEQEYYLKGNYPPGYYPASSAQKKLYILHQIPETGLSYNMTGAMVIEGQLDRVRLESTFAELIRRHEAFRTSFHIIHGALAQRVHPEVDLRMEGEDSSPKGEDSNPRFWGGIPEDSIPDIIREFVRPFDLTQAPLLRIRLLKVSGTGKHILIYDMPHIIGDGVSLVILSREFVQLYRGEKLPPLKINYKDFAVWQNQMLESGAMIKEESYWLQRLAGDIPVLYMPLDYQRPEKRNFKGNRLRFFIAKENTQRLIQFANRQQVTLNMLMFALYTLLINQYSDQQDLIIGSLVSGRRHPDLENMIGVFINFLPIRVNINPEATFPEFLESVKQELLTAYDHQNYPFEMMVANRNVTAGPSRNPLFDTMLVFHNEVGASFARSGARSRGGMELDSLKFYPYEIPRDTTTLDLKLDIIASDADAATSDTGELECLLEYDTALFKRESMERLVKNFQFLCEKVEEL